MPDLQKQRTVPERVAPFHAFAATYAQRFVDRVFVVRFFNKRARDRACRTELILGSLIECRRVRSEKTETKIDQITTKAADKAVKKIKTPIDKAKMTKTIGDDRMKEIDKTLNNQ